MNDGRKLAKILYYNSLRLSKSRFTAQVSSARKKLSVPDLETSYCQKWEKKRYAKIGYYMVLAKAKAVTNKRNSAV